MDEARRQELEAERDQLEARREAIKSQPLPENPADNSKRAKTLAKIRQRLSNINIQLDPEKLALDRQRKAQNSKTYRLKMKNQRLAAMDNNGGATAAMNNQLAAMDNNGGAVPTAMISVRFLRKNLRFDSILRIVSPTSFLLFTVTGSARHTLATPVWWHAFRLQQGQH